MYQKVSTELHFVEREKAILDFWTKQGISRKVLDQNPDGKPFTIYDGPPTANGKPHIGHVLTRSIKDLFPRYHRMKGRKVEFIAGWDTHGLPVELEVEKKLGIDGKEQIEAYGVEPFVQACKSSVWTYKDEWEQMSARVGYSGDMDHPYVTYDNNYIESVWWLIKQIADQGLLYKGYKVVPYCPRCGTALSSHEVAQGYKEVKDRSAYVRFAVKGEENTYFAAWTTTPWTLPSNVALCVNAKETYVLVSVKESDHHGDCNCEAGHHATIERRYYMAKPLVSAVFGEGDHVQILGEFSGADLVGKRYEPLFDYASDIVAESGKDAYLVVADDYVSMSDGTGIVHIAPAFGEDDGRIGQREQLAFVQLVNDDGTMPDAVRDFAGQFCKDADKGILHLLEKHQKLIKSEWFGHSYPFCWRCETPLIYYARHSWFIRMTEVKNRLVANNQTVNWMPENIRDGRFGHFLENVVDWGLSRERYWGTPLPVWTCTCGHVHTIGSIDELKSMSDDCPENIELHKPYIDQVHLNCPACGGQMKRVSEVIDCWFDSGAMPYAQYHYPFEHKADFEAHFPADFISEALDQTRGWFYSLMAISTALGKPAPYKNVIVMGLVQDKNGLKMSKHKGNVVDPWDALERFGADAVRWYFYTNSQPWLPSRYSDAAVQEGQNKFLSTLWNTYAFYVMYAEIDQFNPLEHELKPELLSVIDRWLLSRLNTLVQAVDQGLEQYELYATGRKIADFVDELSNWYVRRNRDRYWAEGMEQDKINAYLTLYTALKTVIHLAAPFIPFMTETIYQNLVRSVDQTAPESIHLSAFPTADSEWIDPDLEADMGRVRLWVTLGRAARNLSQIKNRQPLSRMLVQSVEPLSDAYVDIVLSELNIKALTYIQDATALQDYQFKPQLRLLGKRFGSKLPQLSAALAALNGVEAMQALQKDGQLVLMLDGESVALTADELIIETKQAEGFATATDRGVTVALDLTITPELEAEGFVREIVSKIQTMRKTANFELQDRIEVVYQTDETLQAVFEQYADRIASDVLAVRIYAGDLADDDGADWMLNDHPCRLKVMVI